MTENPRIDDDRRAEAMLFANSGRGHYMISRALTMAIRELEKVEPPFREVGDIEDMRFLRDHLFRVYAEIHEAVEQAADRLKAEHGEQA